MAARRFVDDNLTQEAVAFALDGLQANNWKRLRSYSGRSTFSTFLSSVVLRLFEDFARNRFGRLRPPGWLHKLGGTWLALFRLLCGQRLAQTEAVDNLTINQGHDRKELEEAAATILAKIPDCGHAKGHSQATEQESLDHHAAEETHRHNDSEYQLSSKEKKLLFSVIFRHLMGSSQDSIHAEMFANVQQGIILAPAEQLLLKLCFQDGVPVSEAGRMLELTPHQAHGRLRRLLARIRSDLEKAGIADELLELLKGQS